MSEKASTSLKQVLHLCIHLNMNRYYTESTWLHCTQIFPTSCETKISCRLNFPKTVEMWPLPPNSFWVRKAEIMSTQNQRQLNCCKDAHKLVKQLYVKRQRVQSCVASAFWQKLPKNRTIWFSHCQIFLQITRFTSFGSLDT